MCMKGAFTKKKLPWKGSSIYLVLEDSMACSLNSDQLPCPSTGWSTVLIAVVGMYFEGGRAGVSK